MDIIFIRDLRIDTVIGIYDWERKIHQMVSINLDFCVDTRLATTDDAIEKTKDYKVISKRIQEFVGNSRFLLIETLAERLAEMLQEEFQLSWLQLQVEKPGALRQARSVGIRLERGQKP